MNMMYERCYPDVIISIESGQLCHIGTGKMHHLGRQLLGFLLLLLLVVIMENFLHSQQDSSDLPNFKSLNSLAVSI
jgi:hypothetical protein